MPSTYSPKLKFELIAPGEQPGLWGNTTNKNVGELIEQAIAGVTTLDLTSVSGNYTLTSLDGTLDQARSAVVSCQGTAAGAVSVIIPTSTKLYVFRNACGQTITIKTAGQIGGVVLANGEANSVFCDGTNALAGLVTAGAGTTPVSGGGTGQTSFTSGFLISPSPGGTTAITTQAKISLLGDVVNTLPVANGGTGASTLTAGGLLVGNGTGSVTTLTGGFNGYVPTWSTATNTWISAAPSAAGVTTFNGRPGAVVPLSTDYSAFYYPLTGNPSNFALSSALSGYALLASSPTFTGGVTANGFAANGAISQGDQKFTVSFGGFNGGLAPAALQLGASAWGINYETAPGIAIIGNLGSLATFRFSGNFQYNSSTAWAVPSDVNIKTNVRNINSALDKLNSLKPCHFEYKDNIGKTKTGFIAQEFESVFPGHSMEMVAPDKYKPFLPEGQETIKGLDLDLIPYLVKAVQELSAKVDAQATEIAALKAK